MSGQGLGNGSLPKLRGASGGRGATGGGSTGASGGATASPMRGTGPATKVQAPKGPLTKAPTKAPVSNQLRPPVSSNSVNVVSAGIRDLRPPGSKFSNTGNTGFQGALTGKGLNPGQLQSPQSSSGSVGDDLVPRARPGPSSARVEGVSKPPPQTASPASARTMPVKGRLPSPKLAKHSLSAPVTPAVTQPTKVPQQRRPPGPIKAPTAADVGSYTGSSSVSKGFTSMVNNQANMVNQPTESDQLEVQRLVEQAKWKQMQRNVYTPGGAGSSSQSMVLNLSERGMKMIGAEVLSLDKLTTLNLSSNCIEILPGSIGGLVNMVNFNASNNLILNLPPELANLKSLTDLALAGNRLKTIPQFIGNLTQLQKLYLGSNRLSDLPSTMEKLIDLKVLSIFDNEFAKAPAVVQQMHVKELHLSYNKLSAIPEEYCHLSGLLELHVDCNKLTTLPRSIGLLSGLKILSASGNALQSLPRGVTSMSSLTSLLLCQNKIDILPLGFNQMGITEFDLSNNPLSLDDIAGGFLNSLMSNGVRGPEQKPMLRSHSPLVRMDGKLPIGSGLIQGKRDYMEDRIVVENEWKGVDGDFMAAVFDGHGGEDCAELCREQLTPTLSSALKHSVGVLTALTDTFKALHQQVIDKKITSGSTGTVAIMMSRTLYLANAGDSRAVLCRKGAPIRLSVEHKGTNVEEADRVQKLGGQIVDGRVNRILAVTRAIGDVDLNPYVIPDPDIKVHDISAEDEYLILASDGVWDVMTDAEACRVVLGCSSVQVAALKIRDFAYMNGSMDNISVIVVNVKQRGIKK